MAGGRTLLGSRLRKCMNWSLKDDLPSYGRLLHDVLDEGLGEGDAVEVFHVMKLLDDF